jgi:hypothetical protein
MNARPLRFEVIAAFVMGILLPLGLLGSSFWGQLEETLRHTASEPYNLLIVIVKFLLWSTCVVSLVLSFRRAIHAPSV